MIDYRQDSLDYINFLQKKILHFESRYFYRINTPGFRETIYDLIVILRSELKKELNNYKDDYGKELKIKKLL